MSEWRRLYSINSQQQARGTFQFLDLCPR